MKVLTLSEALTNLENGQWHSITYISADVQKNEAGKIIRIKECRLESQTNSHVKSTNTTAQPIPERSRKSANHRQNATRNLRLRNNMIRKCHIHLIHSLNSTPVI